MVEIFNSSNLLIIKESCILIPLITSIYYRVLISNFSWYQSVAYLSRKISSSYFILQENNKWDLWELQIQIVDKLFEPFDYNVMNGYESNLYESQC